MDSIVQRLAHKYASAFVNTLGTAWTNNELEHLLNVLPAIKQEMNGITFFLSLHLISRTRKQHALETMIATYKLPANLVSLAQLLVKHERTVLWYPILNQVGEQLMSARTIQYVTVSSSADLDDSAVESIRSYLEKETRSTIIINTKIDPSLIAGIKIQSQDYAWEDSVTKYISTVRTLILG